MDSEINNNNQGWGIRSHAPSKWILASYLFGLLFNPKMQVIHSFKISGLPYMVVQLGKLFIATAAGILNLIRVDKLSFVLSIL
jgi:hypothetical protein